MDFNIRCIAILLLALVSLEVTASSHSLTKKLQVTSDPKAIFRQYLEAVRKNDLQAAMKYWVFDEEQPSNALEVIVGMMISMRKINMVSERKLGAEALKEILKGWWRDDITDAALEQTRKDLESALVRLEGDSAELIFTHPHNRPSFKPSESIHFRKVKGQWKLDANKMTGLKPGDNFFAKGTWGPLFRDQLVIMNEAADHMEKGKIRTRKELSDFIEKGIENIKKKLEEDRGK